MVGTTRRAALVLLTALLTAPFVSNGDSVRADGLHAREPALPRQVNAPGAWSDGVGVAGALAAVGIALRNRPDGLTGERQSLQLFGVSAQNGAATWIDLPGVDEEERDLVSWFALSPDGAHLAWTRTGPSSRPGLSGPVLGWAVMDTTTGTVVEIEDETSPRLEPTLAELSFSGDSRYLLTSYARRGETGARQHRFVAWDVTDARPTLLEGPGRCWLPDVGSAPSGVLWSRGRDVVTLDPRTGRRTRSTLPTRVVTASRGPGGSFAWIGHRPGADERQLHTGLDEADSRRHVVDLDIEPDQLLGWRDARHVVVGHYRSDVRVVDVVTGEAERIDLGGQGDALNVPVLAQGLWARPLLRPVERVGTKDPRVTPSLAGGAVLLLALGGLGVVRRRRRRA